MYIKWYFNEAFERGQSKGLSQYRISASCKRERSTFENASSHKNAMHNQHVHGMQSDRINRKSVFVRLERETDLGGGASGWAHR